MKKLLSYLLALLMLVQPMLGTTARAAEIVDSSSNYGIARNQGKLKYPISEEDCYVIYKNYFGYEMKSGEDYEVDVSRTGTGNQETLLFTIYRINSYTGGYTQQGIFTVNVNTGVCKRDDIVFQADDYYYGVGTVTGIVDSGTCGDNLTWTLDNEGTLTISGTGEMWNYEINHTPWNAYFTTVTSLVIEKGITSISDYAFCGFLFYNIEIPDGVTRIGTSAFSQCYYVEDLYIPASVTTIGIEAFLDCGNQGIWVDADNPNYSSDQYGVLFNKNKTTLIQATYRLSGNYQIPKTVVSIADRAFNLCSSLTSVEIPEGVTTIGVDTFYGCYDLASIHIPKSVTSIKGAFSNCSSLADVYYGGTKAQWDAIYIQDSNGYGNEYLLNANIHYASSNEDNKPNPPVSGNPFADVAADAYYFKPVQWAVNNGITNGLSADTFGPDATCTRGQIVTFLWRANGSPKPSSGNNPFRDVPAGQWYTDAVLWAVEKGITTGTSATTFSPDAGCTRGQVATFLWRSQEMPASVMPANAFTDIDPNAYYYNAVLWAVENGITNGTSATTFAPDATCTRGQIVTFLYRNDSVRQYINRYTFHNEDITWSEANEKAKALGGHLVHLNSIGEMGYLLARIYEMDHEFSNYILLGGKRTLEESEYFWVNTDGSKAGDSLHGESGWEKALWLKGEPSLGYAGEWEDVMAMQYSDEDGRWGWNDVPDDLPATIQKNDPSQMGTIVYIVEYDD